MGLGTMEEITEILRSYDQVQISKIEDLKVGYVALFKSSAGTTLFQIVGEKDGKVELRVVEVDRAENKNLIGRTVEEKAERLLESGWTVYAPSPTKKTDVAVQVMMDKEPVANATVEFWGGLPPFMKKYAEKLSGEDGVARFKDVPTLPVMLFQVSKGELKPVQTLGIPMRLVTAELVSAKPKFNWLYVIVPVGIAGGLFLLTRFLKSDDSGPVGFLGMGEPPKGARNVPKVVERQFAQAEELRLRRDRIEELCPKLDFHVELPSEDAIWDRRKYVPKMLRDARRRIEKAEAAVEEMED